MAGIFTLTIGIVGGGGSGSPQGVVARIIIGAGDSNLMGFDLADAYSGGSPESLDTTYSNLLQLGFTSGETNAETSEADDPLDWITPAGTNGLTVSSLTWFGRELASNDPDTVYILIPAALYSNVISNYAAGSPAGSHYKLITEAIDNILAEYPSATISDLIFSIDHTQTPAGSPLHDVIASGLTELITGLQTDYPSITTNLRTQVLQSFPEDIYNVNGTVSTFDADFIPVWEAVRELPLSVDNLFVWASPTMAGQPGEERHFANEPLRERGRLLYRNLSIVDGLTNAVPNQPTIEDAGNGYVGITVPTTGASKYKVEYRTSGSTGSFTSADAYPLWDEQEPGEKLYYPVPNFAISREVKVTALSRAGSSTPSSSVVVGPGIQARYWRVNVTANNGNSFTNCYRLDFRPFTNGPVRNLEGKPIAGSSFGSSNGPERAFKGSDAEPGWVSASNAHTVGTAWIGFRYDEPQHVEEFVWYSRNDGNAAASDQAPQDFTLDYSADGETWITYGSWSGETGWDDNGEARTFSVTGSPIVFGGSPTFFGGSPTFVEPNMQIFSSNGTFVVPAGVTSIDVLVVGGGGGGGGFEGFSNGAGGGGAGRVIFEEGFSVTPLDEITVVVGAGGAGGINTRGDNGQASSFDTITAPGGGGGQGFASGASTPVGGGASGGSGGGCVGAGSGTSSGGANSGGDGFGNDGGDVIGGGAARPASGGGGAFTAGGSITDNESGGNGGDGYTLEFFGFDYAVLFGLPSAVGGGGGGGRNDGTAGAGGLGGGGDGNSEGNGFAAVPNTGGGGGGCGGGDSNATRNGGDGGSGIVIVKWSGPVLLAPSINTSTSTHPLLAPEILI